MANFLKSDPAKHTAKIDFQYRIALGPYAGEADKHRQLISISAPVSEFNGTAGHELGHTMGQVPFRHQKPPGLEDEEYGREYVGNNHQGSHCADGMSDENYADGEGKKGTAYHKDFNAKSECTCIMYGQVNPKGTNKFCDRCQPFVKGQAILTVEK